MGVSALCSSWYPFETLYDLIYTNFDIQTVWNIIHPVCLFSAYFQNFDKKGHVLLRGIL